MPTDVLLEYIIIKYQNSNGKYVYYKYHMEQNFGEANFWWIKLKMHLDGNILAVEKS